MTVLDSWADLVQSSCLQNYQEGRMFLLLSSAYAVPYGLCNVLVSIRASCWCQHCRASPQCGSVPCQGPLARARGKPGEMSGKWEAYPVLFEGVSS